LSHLPPAFLASCVAGPVANALPHYEPTGRIAPRQESSVPAAESQPAFVILCTTPIVEAEEAQGNAAEFPSSSASLSGDAVGTAGVQAPDVELDVLDRPADVR